MNIQIKVLLMLIIVISHVEAEYFSNVAEQINLDFLHKNGDLGNFNYPEIVGSGVGLFDFDNDGDLDIYLVQSGNFIQNKSADKLFINNYSDSKVLSFSDETKSFKLNNNSYGIGIAIADINNDGWVDFYLTNLEQNQMYINQKGRGFKLLNIESNHNSWSTSASFCDINNDGYKDLYVTNYVNWTTKNNPKCYNASSKQDYCGPSSFEGLKDRFYINESGTKLVDKTAQYFSNMPKSPGLNVVCHDVNNDGFNDFIVANDGKANLLWLNQKGKSFKESGLFSGLAVNGQGVAEASMGLALSDFDLDGDLDVFFTHLMNESNTLYKNNGKGYFSDVSNRSKLSAESYAYTGWATGFLMVNDDIYPDLVIFNGAVADSSKKLTDSVSLKQANQLFLNTPSSIFVNVKNEQWLLKKAISRGAAFGDIDNDGDIDIVVNNNNGTPDILLNNQNPKSWMGLKISDKLHRNLKIELFNTNSTIQINYNTDGAYASAHDDRIVLNQAQIEYYNGIRFLLNNKIILEKPLTKTNKYNPIEIE